MKIKTILENLQVMASIGIHDFEKQAPQALLITVELFFQAKVHTDDISQTVDYDFLRESTRRLAAAQHFELQETLAIQVLQACLAQPVLGARVYVRKPDVYPDCDSVGVVVAQGEVW